jgi:hypothetical protein
MKNRIDLKEPSKDIVPVPIGQSLSGKYKVSVLDKENSIIWEQKDWQKNLIVNQGMDKLAQYSYADIMFVAFCGSGTVINSYYTGNSSGSVSTSTLTLVPGPTGLQSLTSSIGGWLSIVQVGDMVHFDNAAEVMVTAVSNLSASVTPSSTIPLQPFTIYKTSQTGLQSLLHLAGTNNYFAGTGYCGTTHSGMNNNITQNRRTWDFNYETSSINVNEVGVGWTVGSAQNPQPSDSYVFSRVLLPSTVSIAANQKLRLIYELDIAITPNASSPGIPFTGSIIGWGTGSYVPGYQNVGGWYLSNIDINGNDTGVAYLDPAVASPIFMSNCTASNPTAGTDLNRTNTAYDSTTTTLVPYVPLSFTIYKTGTFSVPQLVRNDLQTIGIGYAYQTAFCCVFTQPQTKLNTQTLTLTFVSTWGRVLS